ncbi:hypothetical protein HPB47_019132, partial [Ixodes persulcatus]
HTSVDWVSDLQWRNHPRREQGGTLVTISEPFAEELRLLWLLCDVPKICRVAHERGQLHGEKADTYRITRINRVGERDLKRAMAL